MSALENEVAKAFKKEGWIVFLRKNHVDVLAIKPNMSLSYLVECKDYQLSREQQQLAVRELNRNYTHALELLLEKRLHPQRILRVLVAQAFSYQARGVLQYTTTEFLKHLEGEARTLPHSQTSRQNEREVERCQT